MFGVALPHLSLPQVLAHGMLWSPSNTRVARAREKKRDPAWATSTIHSGSKAVPTACGWIGTLTRALLGSAGDRAVQKLLRRYWIKRSSSCRDVSFGPLQGQHGGQQSLRGQRACFRDKPWTVGAMRPLIDRSNIKLPPRFPRTVAAFLMATSTTW